jgi:ATP-binding protein involved in chromosome partitioning
MIGRTAADARGVVRRSVHEGVGSVVDPLVGEPIGELDLLGPVEVDARGHVAVTVRSVSSRSEDVARLRDAVADAMAGVVDGSAGVVRVEVVDNARRAALGHRLRSRHVAPGGLGSRTRIIAVGSGKGGVGKSSVTANLAVALADTGRRVGVLDADVWGYSMPQLFGADQPPVAVSGMMLPVPAHGVRLMSMGFFVSDDEPVVWRGPMLQKALEQFLGDVYWGALDVLLVDLPPGTGDVPLSVMQLLPGASLLVVTTPQHAAVQVAARTGRMALDNRMPLAGVVENMSGGVFGSGGGRRLATALGTPLLGSVPLDERLRASGDAGRPALHDAPDAPAMRAIRQVAEALPDLRPSLVGRQLPLFVS